MIELVMSVLSREREKEDDRNTAAGMRLDLLLKKATPHFRDVAFRLYFIAIHDLGCPITHVTIGIVCLTYKGNRHFDPASSYCSTAVGHYKSFHMFVS